jgi:hypothetical protein
LTDWNLQDVKQTQKGEPKSMEKKTIVTLVVVSFMFVVLSLVMVIVLQNKEHINKSFDISQAIRPRVEALANTLDVEATVQASTSIGSGKIMLGPNAPVRRPASSKEILTMVNGTPDWHAFVGSQSYLKVGPVLNKWWMAQEDGAFVNVNGPQTKNCQWIGNVMREPDDKSYAEYAFTIVGQVVTDTEATFGNMAFPVLHFIPPEYKLPTDGAYNINGVCVGSNASDIGSLLPCQCINDGSSNYITLHFTQLVGTDLILAGTMIQFKADIVMRLESRNLVATP